MNPGDIYVTTRRTKWWDPTVYYNKGDILLDGGEFLIYIGLVTKVDNHGKYIHEFLHWGRKCHLVDHELTRYLNHEWIRLDNGP